MKIAVVGGGSVGAAVGRAWGRAGHDVTVGVRSPDEPRYDDLRASLPVTSVTTALGDCDAVLIATPASALPDVLTAQAAALDGALVMDATNQLSGPPTHPSAFSRPMHQLPLFAERLPSARVYRAFNTLGWESFAEPTFGAETADLLFCGPDGADRVTVEQLIGDVGLRPVWLGGPEAADALDGAARLWFTLALARGHGRHLALRILAEKELS
jgi:8-hydroxy-5-deazaflavin:NADPH oxidoreductase